MNKPLTAILLILIIILSACQESQETKTGSSDTNKTEQSVQTTTEEDLIGKWRWVTYDLSATEKVMYSQEDLEQYKMTVIPLMSKVLKKKTFTFQSNSNSSSNQGDKIFKFMGFNVISLSRGFIKKGKVIYNIKKLDNDTLILENLQFVVTLVRYIDTELEENKNKLPPADLSGKWTNHDKKKHKRENERKYFYIDVKQKEDKLDGMVHIYHTNETIAFAGTVTGNIARITVFYTWDRKTPYNIKVQMKKNKTNLDWKVIEIETPKWNEGNTQTPFPKKAGLFLE